MGVGSTSVANGRVTGGGVSYTCFRFTAKLRIKFINTQVSIFVGLTSEKVTKVPPTTPHHSSAKELEKSNELNFAKLRKEFSRHLLTTFARIFVSSIILSMDGRLLQDYYASKSVLNIQNIVPTFYIVTFLVTNFGGWLVSKCFYLSFVL